MECNYSIEIDGKSYNLLEGVDSEKIRDIDDLKEHLKTVDLKKLTEIKNAFVSSDSIQNINLSDINENSVGLFSPADLLNEISDNTIDAAVWNNLDVGDKKAKIIISGFGDESIKTGFNKDHIFLNLNYLYDKDNNIIALTELALHNKYGNDYKTASNIINGNPNSEEAQGIIKGLINSNYDNVITKIKGAITLAYEKSKIKLTQDIGESNLSVLRDNLTNTWSKFNELRSPITINENYLPKTNILTQDLKQGDLVLIPIETPNKKIKVSGVYEMFYDSFIDAQGKTVLRTLIQNKDTGAIETRKRIAKKYDSNNNIIESNTVQGRIQNSDSYTLFNYEDGIKYQVIDTKVKDGYINYESTLNLLKNPQTKVVINKTDHKIVKIQGSSVTLNTGDVIQISDISKIKYPLDGKDTFNEFNEEDLKNNSNWVKYSHPTIGEHIAFKKKATDSNLVEGVVIATGKRGDNKIIFYKTAEQIASGKTVNKVSYISESNVRYVSAPPSEYHITPSEEIPILDFVNKNFIDQNRFKDFTSVFTARKDNTFKEMDYSVQQINKYSKISPKDLIYDISSRKVFKVVHSGQDLIKAVALVNGNMTYFDLPKDVLDKYLLFTNTPINESFASSYIRKNRANLYKSAQDGSIEAIVWKNPNGYIYALPKNLTEYQRKQHILYEEARDINGKTILPVNVTSEIINELKSRYKWEDTPKTLFMKYGLDKKTILKDTENTLRIPIDNDGIKKIFDTSDYLQSYLVPGSFIQFKGNVDNFIVEKVHKDRIELASYHHTFSPNDRISNDNLRYVKSEKFFLDKDGLQNVEVTNLYLPKWATAAYDNLSQFKKDFYQKNSKITKFSESDSPEIVAMLADVVRKKYNTEVNIVHNHDLAQFNNQDVYKSAAFVNEQGIYVNIDKASIGEPLHEVLHLVLATMKASDPKTYYSLVNSVQYHPLFEEVSKSYNEINAERLEETFVKLLSRTFRQNILKEGIYNEASFNRAIKQSISDLMDLSKELNWEDSFDLLKTPISDILFDFGSKLVENDDALIDKKSVSYTFDISKKIKSLLDEGKLEQKCSY